MNDIEIKDGCEFLERLEKLSFPKDWNGYDEPNVVEFNDIIRLINELNTNDEFVLT